MQWHSLFDFRVKLEILVPYRIFFRAFCDDPICPPENKLLLNHMCEDYSFVLRTIYLIRIKLTKKFSKLERNIKWAENEMFDVLKKQENDGFLNVKVKFKRGI